MKFWKKGILTLLLAGSVALAGTQSASACIATPGCGATGKSVECAIIFAMVPGTHTYIGPDGKEAICATMETRSLHHITCLGCGAKFADEVRTCTMTHNNAMCPHYGSRINLCK